MPAWKKNISNNNNKILISQDTSARYLFHTCQDPSSEENECFQVRQLCQKCFSLLSIWVCSERKEFAPLGSILFPFTADPFQFVLGVQESKQKATNIVSLVKMAWKPTKCIWQLPLTVKYTSIVKCYVIKNVKVEKHIKNQKHSAYREE